jgi:hypothetical protein
MLHYNLGILLLANVIEGTDRLELLTDIKEDHAQAEGVIVNMLMFGLNNTVTLDVKVDSGTLDAIPTTQKSITVPIISIDPYPHHVLAVVQLVQKAVDRDLASGKICQNAHDSLQVILERTLNHLPQSSKSVKKVRDTIFSKDVHYVGRPFPMPFSV